MGLFGNKEHITARLSAYGLASKRAQQGEYELKQGAKVSDLLKKAGVDPDGPGLVLMIEGKRVEPTLVLKHGDELKLFFLAGGG
ncbi:MAG: MoaD/ThiS family protein [Deltaproteobacteria bacterium]|nr:MoaD/ThiS family protein [Deltaproteobacteria bacterium]